MRNIRKNHENNLSQQEGGKKRKESLVVLKMSRGERQDGHGKNWRRRAVRLGGVGVHCELIYVTYEDSRERQRAKERRREEGVGEDLL